MRLPAIPDPKSSLADRVRWLLDDYWKGNRKKCADDVGVSPTYISRIATETNNPGTDLLEKLAEKPFINTRWLLTGAGTPYLSAEQQLPTSWMLPVVNELPNGPIQQPSSLLARQYKEIDASNYSISRCWTQLVMSDDLAHRGEYGYQVGDYILWETNPAYWKDLSIFHRRPAVVTGKSSSQPVMKILEYHEETEEEAAYLSSDDLTRPPLQQPPYEREYTLKILKDNRLHIKENNNRKRQILPAYDHIYSKDRRRILAVAIMRSGNY